MKLYYKAVCLTFLLSFQGVRSQPKLSWSSSIREKLFSSETDNVCKTAECRKSAAMLKNYMRRSANNCENFYEFACGSFSSKDKPVSQLNKKIMGYLRSPHDHNIRAFRNVQRIFRKCKDEDAIKKFGVKVIQLHLRNVGLPTIPRFQKLTIEAKNFDRILAKIYGDAAIPIWFRVHVSFDRKDKNKNSLYIGLGRFTLKVLNTAVTYPKTYKNYMIGVIFHLYDLEDTEISREFLQLISGLVDQVLGFFYLMNNIMVEYNFSVNSCKLMKIRNLQEKTDRILQNSNVKFNWSTYLSTVFNDENVGKYYLSGEHLYVCAMSYIEEIFKIISETDEIVLEISVWWLTVENVINIGDEKLQKLYKVVNKDIGISETDRKTECLDFVKDEFGHILTHLLLQEVDLKYDKAEIDEMTEYVRMSFEETINNAQWLDESTRDEAIKKLHKIDVVISHESWVESLEEIEDRYADVKLEDSWYMTRRALSVRTIKNNLNLLFIENQSHEKRYDLNPLKETAEYKYYHNSVFLPFGYLELININHGLRCMDYGVLAFAMGHAFMHAFTREGAYIDSSGDFKNWWNENTLQEFNNRAQGLVDSYSKFIFKKKVIENDGYLTLDNNIADNVGMKLAFDAYDLYTAKYGSEPKLIGFEKLDSEQLLTLAMASTLCTDASYKTTQNKLVDKSPPPLRINGIFINSDRMAKIWECPLGSSMNPTENKCCFW